MTRLRLAASAGFVALLAASALVPAAQPDKLPPGDPGPRPDRALDAVPRDGFAVVSVKVSQLWDHPTLKPLRDWMVGQKGGTLEHVLGVGPGDVDRVTLFWVEPAQFDDGPLLLVTTRKPYNEARVLKALLGDGDLRDQPRPDRRGGPRSGNVVALSPEGYLVLVDESTLFFNFHRHNHDPAASAALVGRLLARNPAGPLAAALDAAAAHTVVVGVDVAPLAALAGREGLPRELAPYTALLRARTGVFTADLDKGLTGRLALTFADAAAARRAGPVLEELIADLAGKVEAEGKRAAERAADGPGPEAVLAGWLTEAMKGAKVEVKESTVTATVQAPVDEALGKLVAALPKALQAGANQSRAQGHLKQILLALHNYHDTMGQFPGDVVPIGPNNRPAWSWRVQILPYIEQDALFKQLNLQKPWDDPANKAVLERAEMPRVFEVPGRSAPKNHTYWRSFSQPRKAAPGPGRPWLVEGEPGPRITNITDGTSNTFAVVEAGEAVPWYAPDVLAFEHKKPLPPLGGKDASRFLAGFGDGSVRSISKKTDEQTLRALITLDGGEVFTLPDR